MAQISFSYAHKSHADIHHHPVPAFEPSGRSRELHQALSQPG